MTYIEFEQLMTTYTDQILEAATHHQREREPEYRAAREAAVETRAALWQAIRSADQLSPERP